MEIKVLIVDDSPFIRKAIIRMLKDDHDIVVVGEAANGKEALIKAVELQPDVITLDVEMPVMDGLTTLKELMDKNPIPVIMFSSITEDGAKVTLDALRYGAVDYLPKDFKATSISVFNKKKIIISKIRTAYSLKHKIAKLKRHSISKVEILQVPQIGFEKRKGKKDYRFLLIGTSTGGPPALERVLKSFPANFPLPILIVQHMPPVFTKSLADRLNSVSQIKVKEAANNDIPLKGHAYVAPGNFHMLVDIDTNDQYKIKISDQPDNLLYKPSVDVMFESVAKECNQSLLSVIMTGMGKDGKMGCTLIKHKNGTVIAQDEDSCVVYGMPRAVVEENLADYVLPIDQIPKKIIELVS